MSEIKPGTWMVASLSKTTRVEIIVWGPVGVAEIDRLIERLKLDREILEDSDNVPVNQPPEQQD